MASTAAVWGIDIGQCALKALRCKIGDDKQQLVADAFDYIEYPKILSQPDADPGELIAEALELFLSRNEVAGDKVAISVAGQNGLARFIKLPPVESKKIPDIVRYEAKQQIPFALEDVIWDYQKMPGGGEEDGFSMETEVGVFAMKREQVIRAIEPFEKAGIELDFIQLTPLTIYNFVAYDVLVDLPSPDQYDPESPPESLVILSLGTDTSDLVITNGYRVWQRSIPLGGSHFTKQLTKEMKLTFAKAEHLKRNVRQSKDPKRVFQAMRTVFNDLVTEVQRSVGYFQSIDRDVRIERVLVMGNAIKLPGLLAYLEKNLGYKVIAVQSFQKLGGSAITSSPTFSENLPSFPICYGLTLQALGQATLETNLLPREIVTDRMVREKKPWVVAAVAALLFGFLVNFGFTWKAWSEVRRERYANATSAVNNANSTSRQYLDQDEQNQQICQQLGGINDVVVSDQQKRRAWLELYTAILAALPDGPGVEGEVVLEQEIHERPFLYVDRITSNWMSNAAEWWTPQVQGFYVEGNPEAKPANTGIAVSENMAGDGMDQASLGEDSSIGEDSSMLAENDSMYADDGAGVGLPGPVGPGWQIDIVGHHFHNASGNSRDQYVRSRLLKQLLNATLQLPDGPNGEMIEVRYEDLGIKFPLVNRDLGGTVGNALVKPPSLPAAEQKSRQKSRNNDTTENEGMRMERYDFVVQMWWQPTTPRQRRELQESPPLEVVDQPVTEP